MTDIRTATVSTTAEIVEAETLHLTGTRAPRPVRDALGMTATRIGGGVVLAMRGDVTGYWSRALGFGVTEPMTADVLHEIVGYYRDHGVRDATIQVAPDLLPPDWDELCEEYGLRAESESVKLLADVDDVIAWAEALLAGTAPGVVVEPLDAADAPEWGTVVVRGLGMPEQHYDAMIAATASHPDFAPFAARRHGRLVGAATLRVAGEVGHLFACAVLPEAWSRGGQTGLLLARARAARDRGCRRLVAETDVETPGVHNSSLHAMTRVGFEVQYQRTNLRWRA